MKKNTNKEYNFALDKKEKSKDNREYYVEFSAHYCVRVRINMHIILLKERKERKETQLKNRRSHSKFKKKNAPEIQFGTFYLCPHKSL